MKIPHPYITRREVVIEIDDRDEPILKAGTRYFDHYLDDQRDVAIDLGAHVGCTALYLAAELGFKKVLAVEAYWENFRVLVNNIYANGLQDIVIPMWAAAANVTGEFRPIYWSRSMSNHGQYSTFFNPTIHIPANFTQTISIVHLLTLYPSVDLLKVDIEGGEYEIFNPAITGLWDALKRVNFLDLETHCPEDSFFKRDCFAAHGYPDTRTANDQLKKFLSLAGFDLKFRGANEGGMQGFNGEYNPIWRKDAAAA